MAQDMAILFQFSAKIQERARPKAHMQMRDKNEEEKERTGLTVGTDILTRPDNIIVM